MSHLDHYQINPRFTHFLYGYLTKTFCFPKVDAYCNSQCPLSHPQILEDFQCLPLMKDPIKYIHFSFFLSWRLLWNNGYSPLPTVKTIILSSVYLRWKGREYPVCGIADTSPCHAQWNWIVCKSCCLRDGCTYKLPNGTLIDFDYMTDSKAGAFQTVFKLMAATFGKEPNGVPGSL